MKSWCLPVLWLFFLHKVAHQTIWTFLNVEFPILQKKSQNNSGCAWTFGNELQIFVHAIKPVISKIFMPWQQRELQLVKLQNCKNIYHD